VHAGLCSFVLQSGTVEDFPAQNGSTGRRPLPGLAVG
jgi:hypothetical protein